MKYKSFNDIFGGINIADEFFATDIVSELQALANRYANKYKFKDLRYMIHVNTSDGPFWQTAQPQNHDTRPSLPLMLQAIEANPTGALFCRIDPESRYRIIRVVDDAKFASFVSDKIINGESLLPYIFIDPITKQHTKYILISLPRRVPLHNKIEEIPEHIGIVFERDSVLAPLPGGKYCRARSEDIQWFIKNHLESINSDLAFALFGEVPDGSPSSPVSRHVPVSAKADAAVVRALARIPYIRTRDDFRRALQALYSELKDLSLNKIQAKPYLQRFMDAAEAADLPRKALEEELLWILGADKEALRVRRLGNSVRGLSAATDVDIDVAQEVKIGGAIIESWVHQGVFPILAPRTSLHSALLSEHIAKCTIYGTPLFGKIEPDATIPGRVCIVYPDCPSIVIAKAARRINDKNFYFKILQPMSALTECDQSTVMDIISGDTSVIIFRMSWDYISSVSRAISWMRPIAELYNKLIIIESSAMEKTSMPGNRTNWVQYAEFMYSGLSQNLLRWMFIDCHELFMYVSVEGTEIVPKKLAPNDIGLSLLEPFMALGSQMIDKNNSSTAEVSLQLIKDILGYNSAMLGATLRLGRVEGYLKNIRGNVAKLTHRGLKYGREMWEQYKELLMPMLYRYKIVETSPMSTMPNTLYEDDE